MGCFPSVGYDLWTLNVEARPVAYYAYWGVETITFEPGSSLREIAPGAFSECQLKHILLPASLQTITGDSLPPSNCRTEIESGNPHFESKDGYVIDSNDHSILAYCGTASEVIIPAEIAKIGPSAFIWCSQIRTVSFCDGS
jgi:hypothetical protein